MQIEPLTGARKPEQTDGPLGGLQISNAVTDLAPKVLGGPFATASARDTAYASWVTAGNSMRDGLECWLTGTGHQVYTSAHGWVTVLDGAVPARQARAWKFSRTSGNNTDQFAPGSFASLISGTAAGAPAGAYLATVVLTLSAVASASGNLRLMVGGVNVSGDIKEDLTTSSRIMHFSTTYTHAGGDLTTAVSFQASQTGTIANAGCQINLAYLGPQ